METMQPWGGRFNLPQPPVMQKPPQQQITLSREEQLEAKRLAEEANFSFEGYQVVRREFISHRFDPAMTIRGNSITFNNSCISKLENATYIQFLINPTEKKLIIRPCDIGARDAIRWCIVNEKYYLNYYDEVEIRSKSSYAHYRSAIQVRNRYMVDRSELVLCYIQRNNG